VELNGDTADWVDYTDLLTMVEEDVLDIALATARMLTAGHVRHSLNEVLDRFGYTREQLRDLPE
jgi:hypothetical protein